MADGGREGVIDLTTGEEEEGGAGASLCCRDVSVGKEKTKGVLHLRSSKLIFLPYKFDNNRVEVDCTRVSSLQVSKTGGSKALLRLSISGGEDVTFDFTGAGDGFSWRDTFKDAAAEIIRSSTSSSSKKQSGSSGGKGGGAAPEKKAAKEENVEQHRLDASTIFKYFKKYPKLAKVYEEQVPHAMSEQEFWRRFLEAKKLRESSSAESDISTSIMNKSEGKETNNAGHSNSFRASHLALDLTAIENSASLKASASRRYEETCHMERSAIIGYVNSNQNALLDESLEQLQGQNKSGRKRKEDEDCPGGSAGDALKYLVEHEGLTPQRLKVKKISQHELAKASSQSLSRRESARQTSMSLDLWDLRSNRIPLHTNSMQQAVCQSSDEVAACEEEDEEEEKDDEEEVIVIDKNLRELLRHMWGRLIGGREEDAKFRKLEDLLEKLKKQIEERIAVLDRTKTARAEELNISSARRRRRLLQLRLLADAPMLFRSRQEEARAGEKST